MLEDVKLLKTVELFYGLAVEKLPPWFVFERGRSGLAAKLQDGEVRQLAAALSTQFLWNICFNFSWYLSLPVFSWLKSKIF